jgi:hypothetical protein
VRNFNANLSSTAHFVSMMFHARNLSAHQADRDQASSASVTRAGFAHGYLLFRLPLRGYTANRQIWLDEHAA